MPSRKGKKPLLEQRRAVVMDTEEKRAYTLIQQLNTFRNEKMQKRHQQKVKRQALYEKVA